MSGHWYVAVSSVLLVQLILRTGCVRVAPSDFFDDTTCRTDFAYRTAHDWIPYANDTSSGTWKVLIDQYDYQSILGFGGVWKAISADTDERTFAQGSGGTCSYQMNIANTFMNSNSNNWVFTQAIDYLDAVELIVNATVRFAGCVQRRVANPPCRNDYVILHRYDTNTLSETERSDPDNYQPYNGTAENSRLEQDQVNTDDDTTIIGRFRRPANINYTYLGLQDIGTSGIVSRVFMYYEVCPGRVEGLVTYPEVPHPGRLPGAVSRTTRLARCAEHSHNTTSLETYAYQDGRCEQRVGCDCDAGYEENGHECVACTAGKYRTTQNSSCVDCPANSISLLPASDSCNCNEGHYRVSGSEGVGLACTAPPAPISSCGISRSFDTALAIQWSTPAHCGGRSDCYYRVKLNDGPPMEPADDRTLRNLQPDTTYSITVSVHNGVSDQDPENARLRECTFTATTLQGSVFMLGGVTYPNNTAILVEDIDSTNPLICTTASTTCCEGVQDVGFYDPDDIRILSQSEASSHLQSLFMTQSRGSISLSRQIGESSLLLGRYRCEIPDGTGTKQRLYIRIGTAISPPGPNDTIDEPAIISVLAAVDDVIVLNIPTTLASVLDKIEARIEERQTSAMPVQTKAPIIFTASIGPQLIIRIPKRNITAIEKGSAYFVKIKPIFVNGSRGQYGLPYLFNGTVIRDVSALPSSSSSSSGLSCINFSIFIGVIVGIVVFAAIVIILILVSLCVTCKKKRVQSSHKRARNAGFNDIKL